MPTDRSFYNVPSSSASVFRDLEGPLKIPGRSALHPPLYLWTGTGPHPQRTDGHETAPENAFQGKTYVLLVDPSEEGKEMLRRFEKSHKIPLGREQVAIDAGECPTLHVRQHH